MDAETSARMELLATATPYACPGHDPGGDTELWVVGWVFTDREAGLEFVRQVARMIAAQNKPKQ